MHAAIIVVFSSPCFIFNVSYTIWTTFSS